MVASGMGFDARLTLIDPRTGAILRRSKTWDLYTERQSAKNLMALGLMSEVPENPGGRTTVPAAPPQIRLAYRVEVHDLDRNPKSDTGWVDADSLTVPFIKIFLSQTMRNLTAQEVVDDIDGVSRTLIHAATTRNFRMNQAVPADGPVVGSSSTAVTVDDTALGTLITDGAAAGQLDHGATSISAGSFVGTEESLTITRLFTNNTGSTVTIREVGLHCQARDSGVVERTFMIARDLTGDQPVLNLEVATLTWKLLTADVGTDFLFDILSGMMRQVFPGSGFPGQIGSKTYITAAVNNPFPNTEVLDMRGQDGGSAAEIAAGGINVGSSSNVFSPAQTVYSARITTFVQSAMVSSAVFSSGGNRRFLVTRSFTNNTGGSLTIREVGLGGLSTGKTSEFVNDIIRSFLVARQVVTDFVVANDQVAVVEFQIQI